MDTITLLKDLKTIQEKHSKHLKPMKVNVFPADRLPKRKLDLNTNNYFIIANDSPSSSPGTHWIAFYICRKNEQIYIEYFDSYGFSPYKNKYFARFLKRADKVKFNKKLIQSPFSTKCGKYCVCFLYHKSLNKPLTSFVKLFSQNLSDNDKKIEKMYNQVTKHTLRNQFGGSCKNNNIRSCIQTCCSLINKM